jgi:hypothetical protein
VLASFSCKDERERRLCDKSLINEERQGKKQHTTIFLHKRAKEEEEERVS